MKAYEPYKYRDTAARKAWRQIIGENGRVRNYHPPEEQARIEIQTEQLSRMGRHLTELFDQPGLGYALGTTFGFSQWLFKDTDGDQVESCSPLLCRNRIQDLPDNQLLEVLTSLIEDRDAWTIQKFHYLSDEEIDELVGPEPCPN